MGAISYAIRTKPFTTDHGWPSLSWLGDYGEPADESEAREYNYIDAQAASGDWFITLATRLDKLAQGMPQDSAEQIEIEHLVKTLFYLQDHWKLAPKTRKD